MPAPKKKGGEDPHLRDFFAGLAMLGLIHHFHFETFRDAPKKLAGWAYDAADAMIIEKERRSEGDNA